jgi:hypothetical protein
MYALTRCAWTRFESAAVGTVTFFSVLCFRFHESVRKFLTNKRLTVFKHNELIRLFGGRKKCMQYFG